MRTQGVCCAPPKTGPWKLPCDSLSFSYWGPEGMMEHGGRSWCSWIPVCKASYQTPALEYCWPLNTDLNCANPFIRGFFPINIQSALSIPGFCIVDSINCRLKTVFSGDAEGWLYAYSVPFYIRNLSICDFWYRRERGHLEPIPCWRMTVVKFLGSQTLYVYLQLHRVLAHPTPALFKGHLYHHTSKK